MTGGFGFPAIENHWSNFIKNHFFRKKAFPSPKKSNLKKLKNGTIDYSSSIAKILDLSLTFNPCHEETNLFYFI
jgi:hypothetical protein